MRTRLSVALCLAALAGGVLPVVTAAGAAAAIPHQTLHFATLVGPHGDVPCDVVADLYTPPGVDAAHPAPAILATNGFGGSKDDLAGLAQQFGRKGYVFLAYSGLGFGGSGCKIELDDPDYDGKAGSQLVDFLGGKSGNAFTDAAHTVAVKAPDYVVRDDLARRPAADGRIHADDPRVGMIGDSYGGEIQFAVASVDPRVDAIIPQITWNDLSYSLAPNNVASPDGVTYPASNPGLEKLDWVSLFFGAGIADGVTGAQADQGRLVGCPNFDDRACPAKAEMDLLGYPTPDTLALAHHASVASYLDDIRIPTLLSQGQADTLFTLRESVATYQALSRRGVPVKLIWQQWGHSGGAAPGEYDTSAAADPTAFYDNARYLAWFDHYLKGRTDVSTGPAFAWFRDDVKAGATGLADPRYQAAPRYPAVPSQHLYLSAPVATSGVPGAPCAAGSLVARARQTQPGSVPILVAPQVPTSYTETSDVDQSEPLTDAPCTAAVFDGPVVPRASVVVGVPELTLHLDAPTYAVSQLAGPVGQLVLFVKLLDVAPDGTATLPHRLIAPIRVADATRPVTLDLAGVVHLLPAGHHLELRIAAGDAAYRGNPRPGLVNVVLDPAAPSRLLVPLGPA